jgi:hypothetical protein
MSQLTRFDIHTARINAATTMDEFVRANEAAVFDDRYVHLSGCVPYCDCRLICMRSYAELVDMAVDFNQNNHEEEDKAENTTSY